MTECHVSCRDCATPPKVWPHLCTDCAQEQLEAHRAATGHDPQLWVAQEVTVEDVRREMAAAAHTVRRWPPW